MTQAWGKLPAVDWLDSNFDDGAVADQVSLCFSVLHKSNLIFVFAFAFVIHFAVYSMHIALVLVNALRWLMLIVSIGTHTHRHRRNWSKRRGEQKKYTWLGFEMTATASRKLCTMERTFESYLGFIWRCVSDDERLHRNAMYFVLGRRLCIVWNLNKLFALQIMKENDKQTQQIPSRSLWNRRYGTVVLRLFG